MPERALNGACADQTCLQKWYRCDGLGLSATHAFTFCDAMPLSAAQRIAKGNSCLGLVAMRSLGRRDSLLRLRDYGAGDDKSCGS